MKPIEEGCLCIIVNAPCDDHNGDTGTVVTAGTPKKIKCDKGGECPGWTLRDCRFYEQCEAGLLRIDGDPVTEPTEMEVVV